MRDFWKSWSERSIFQKAGVDMESVTTIHFGRNSDLDVLVMTDRPERHVVDDWYEITKYACWKSVVLATILRQSNNGVRYDCYGVTAWVENSPEADMYATMMRSVLGCSIDDSDETVH